ncbi:efflux RND transporter periplasmic adaptor subunit [Paucihalobacter sp.]|uniref:efflux RND transporter periplasmic adaptor subunit n=1 Tax=Paucihalobacter sp. TaxID=2850405 RepID=UPI003D1611D4
MKKIFLLASTALLIISCGNKNKSVEEIVSSNNLEEIRQKKIELDGKQQEIADQLKVLSAKIKELDPLEKVPLVTTFLVEHDVFSHFVELQGNVKTDENIIIYSEFSGVMTNVYVRKGQKVVKGQALAKIDDGGLSKQVKQLQIQSDLAKTTYERQKRLWEQNIGSEIQYLQTKTSYESQLESINQLKQQIAKTIVKAPFSGTIDDVITEMGSVVTPNLTELFRIVNLNDMYIETEVPERYIGDVSKGKNVKVVFPILGIEMDAKVRETGNYINPANRSFKIEVAIPNKDNKIKPNLTAKLMINDYSNNEAVLVPLNIISENAEGEQYVYKVNEKKNGYAIANRVIIKTGKTQGDLIEVLEGLSDNDEVIQEGARSVSDGQKIQIAESEIKTAKSTKK